MRSLFIFVSLMALVNFANAAEYKMTLHHFFSPKEPAQAAMLRPWADEVEKLSKGKVEINIAPRMSLGGKPSELVKQAQKGRVDLVWTINGYSDRKFIRSEVFELPFVHTNDPSTSFHGLPPQSSRGGQDATLPTNPTQTIKSPNLDKTQRSPEIISAGSTTQTAFGY